MDYMKFLRYGVLGALCLVLFVPFIIADGGVLSVFPAFFFPYITGKNFAFRIIVELAFGLWALMALRDPKYRPRSSMLLYVMAAFTVWMGLATLLSVDPAKSFWSNFERMDGYVTLLHLFILSLVAGTVLTAEKWWENFLRISIVASMLMGLFSMLQLFGVFAISSQSGSRLDSTFGNAAYLAVYMLFHVFITFFMAVRERRSRFLQSFYGIALVLQVATIYYTETRGALLGLIGGLIVAGLFIVWKGHHEDWKRLRKLAIWGLGILAAIILIFLAARETSFVKKSNTLQRIASISLADKTTQSRFLIWNMGYKGVMEKPLFGWGQENFSFVFNKYYDPKMYGQEQWFDRAHDQFIDWAVAGGIPAFLLYISLFVLAGLAFFRTSALSVPEQAAFLGLLAGYGFNNIFVFDNLMSAALFFIVLAFAHSLTREELPKWMFLSKPLRNETMAIVAPMVIAVVLLGMWALNAPGIARASNLLDAVMTVKAVSDGKGGTTGAQKDVKENLASFKAALANDTWPGTALGMQEATEQLAQFSANSIASAQGVDPSVRAEYYATGASAIDALIADRPNDARIELFAGGFYKAFGDQAKAFEHLQKALAASPSKQTIIFEIAINYYLAIGDTKSALVELEKAYMLEPTARDAAILYAAGLYYANLNARADALLVERFGTVNVDDNRLLQVYVGLKRFDRAILIWQTRVANDPKNAEQHIGLANIYFMSGDKTRTINELKIAITLNPALAAQINQAIEQIQNGTLQP